MHNTQCAMRSMRYARRGSILALVVVALAVLAALGVGLLTLGYGARLQAIQAKTEAVAMLAAEAGYEKAIFWMGQQQDMLSALQQGAEGTSGTIDFASGNCSYNIELYSFAGSRPIYKVVSSGYSGNFSRTVEVLVIQAASGWDMGKCRVPFGEHSTLEVYFADGEVIDMPLHINNHNDNPDQRDVYISGSPQFLQPIGVAESRYTTGGYDKYASVLDLFQGGIYFDQPDCKVTDEASIQSKIQRFASSTKAKFTFTPAANAPVTNRLPAVQLEFFVEDDIGKVRITNNCTVRSYKRPTYAQTLDYKIKPGTGGTQYEKYYIYAYHLMSENAESNGDRFIRPVDETYVTQSIDGIESEPGGQIFVDGNIVIGGDKSSDSGDQIVKGKITVVATGNIWIADSILLDGPHDADGKPSEDNPNVLGLLSRGVVKVVDPGMSAYGYVDGSPAEPAGYEYVPIGRADNDSGTPADEASGEITVEALGPVYPGVTASFQASHPNVPCEEFDNRALITIDADKWVDSHVMNGCNFTVSIPEDAVKLNIQIDIEADDYPQLSDDIFADVTWLFDANHPCDGGTHKRHLPDPMVVEAAITVGGGGWGAENVLWDSFGGRKEEPGTGSQNDLVVRGTITEAVRGVVGLIGGDGFLKHYYMDDRLLEGIMPGDMWLRGKFIPAPAGWHDYRQTSED